MTITLTREEAQQVLDALDEYYITTDEGKQLVENLRARLAQPEPEPVAWCIVENGRIHGLVKSKPAVMNAEKWQPLYIAPPQQEWVGLTHEEKMEILTRSITAPSRIDVAEAMLKEKNNG